MLRNVALLLFAFGILVLQSGIGAELALHPFAPNLILPIAIYLGVQHDVPLLRGASLSFVFGYFLDEFSGSPMGASTFATLATFLAARGAGVRLFLRGAPFQMALVFATALLTGGSVLALRAIFSPPSADAFPLEMPIGGAAGEIAAALGGGQARVGNAVGGLLVLLAYAAATAVCGPPIFSLVHRIESLRARRRETEAPG